MRKSNDHRTYGTGFLTVLAFLFIFICSPGSTVYARQTQIGAVFPVGQTFTVKNAGQASVELSGTYELTALDADSPMPEGSADGSYTFTLDGSEQRELLVTYVHGGSYRYRLRQITPDAERYDYDRRIYTIRVYVQNGKDGELTALVIAENEQKEKCENLFFENTYTGKAGVSIQKPGSLTTEITSEKTENSTTDETSTTTEISTMVGTGDETPLGFWLLLLVSAAGMAIGFLERKKD